MWKTDFLAQKREILKFYSFYSSQFLGWEVDFSIFFLGLLYVNHGFMTKIWGFFVDQWWLMISGDDEPDPNSIRDEFWKEFFHGSFMFFFWDFSMSVVGIQRIQRDWYPHGLLGIHMMPKSGLINTHCVLHTMGNPKQMLEENFYCSFLF